MQYHAISRCETFLLAKPHLLRGQLQQGTVCNTSAGTNASGVKPKGCTAGSHLQIAEQNV